MALSEDEWIRRTRSRHLTVGDVAQLLPGQSVRLLHMDRNLSDVTQTDNGDGQPRAPLEYFRRNIATYTHHGDLAGHIHWSFGEGRPFEFDVEFLPENWYPSEGGRLPVRDAQNFCPNLGPLAGKHWTEFPPHTRVGWRGPVMLSFDVEHSPPVFWESSARSDEE